MVFSQFVEAAKQAIVEKGLKRIQARLNFEGSSQHPQFADRKGLGRAGFWACALGLLLGVHTVLALQLSFYFCFYYDDPGAGSGSDHPRGGLGGGRLVLSWQWSTYVSCLCVFHLSEFFVTAVYNPTATNSDSFLVNHSLMYTAAAISSWIEFWVRFLFFPPASSSSICLRLLLPSAVGLPLVVVSQVIRSTAMATAGESFNHYIQTSRKDNHVLVTHGIYRYLRHPSYVGFYYWSVGTQLLLGNVLHAVAFAAVSWRFFMKRIAYEEESLCKFFPNEYPEYVARSWMGIPFLYSKVDTSKVRAKKEE